MGVHIILVVVLIKIPFRLLFLGNVVIVIDNVHDGLWVLPIAARRVVLIVRAEVAVIVVAIVVGGPGGVLLMEFGRKGEGLLAGAAKYKKGGNQG